jgi:AraC-like DNA-binding protein
MRLPPSVEWIPSFPAWSFIQVRSGISYWQQGTGVRELAEGVALVLTGETRGGLRASQLGEVTVSYFCLDPGRLTGLLSLSEQHSLKRAAGGERVPFRILAADHPVSERFKGLCLNRNGGNLSARLQLLQLFVDVFNCEIGGEPAEPAGERDGLGRLRQFLRDTAASEFVELSLSDLAPRMGCSPRHLSRLFRKEVGTSFRQKQTELRLARACELLATSNAKVVDVALTSGYQSNSLFSLMFKKRFGVSPGKWRERHGRKGVRRQKLVRMLPV